VLGGLQVDDLLVIVPCGQSKVWDKEPDRGPVRAKDAYTGAPFKINRAYAEAFASRWVILSAKYGFILPDSLIPGPYEVTFKERTTNPVGVDRLIEQIYELRLNEVPHIIGLGGKEYRAMIERAFASFTCSLVFPFSGLSIGLAMQETKRAIQNGDPWGRVRSITHHDAGRKRGPTTIPFPARSQFLDDLRTGIKSGRQELLSGGLIEIRLRPGGYQGNWVVILRPDDQERFDVKGRVPDESRFPQRIRVAAWALHQEGLFGRFAVSHARTGVLTIQRDVGTREHARAAQSRHPVLPRAEPKIANARSGNPPETGAEVKELLMAGLKPLVIAAIRAGKPGGITRSYFEEARGWEAPTRQSFVELRSAIASDKDEAQSRAIDLLKILGTRYKAIWPDTRIEYPVFYEGAYAAVNRRGWWTAPLPALFGSEKKDAAAIVRVVRDALSFFALRGDDRHYSLLTKWLQFCFPDTFAIFDRNASKSIQVAIAALSTGSGLTGMGLEHFLSESISRTNGAGYGGLLSFYRLFWNSAQAAGLAGDLESVAADNEALLRTEPGCRCARVTTLDILDKLLWKANGSANVLGIGGS
jgi:hypothetical protein